MLLEQKTFGGSFSDSRKEMVGCERADFNKTYNTLRICNNGACYQFQVKSFDMEPLLLDLSDKKEPNDIIKGTTNFPSTCDAFLKSMKNVQTTLYKLQLIIQQKNAKVVDSKLEVEVHAEGIQSVIEKSKVEVHKIEDEARIEDVIVEDQSKDENNALVVQLVKFSLMSQ